MALISSMCSQAAIPRRSARQQRQSSVQQARGRPVLLEHGCGEDVRVQLRQRVIRAREVRDPTAHRMRSYERGIWRRYAQPRARVLEGAEGDLGEAVPRRAAGPGEAVARLGVVGAVRGGEGEGLEAEAEFVHGEVDGFADGDEVARGVGVVGTGVGDGADAVEDGDAFAGDFVLEVRSGQREDRRGV